MRDKKGKINVNVVVPLVVLALVGLLLVIFWPQEPMQEKEEYEFSAQDWLTRLRESPSENTLWLLRNAVNEEGIELKDIDSSEEELEELRLKACKLSAQYYLEELRERPSENTLWLLRNEVEEGKFTLKEISTSEEELEELRKACQK